MLAKLTHTLLNEIGHEIKNKLGIIGSLLQDLSNGLEIDKDSISDSLKVYLQLITLSKALTLSINFQKENKDSKEMALNYLHDLFILLISSIDPRTNFSEKQNFTLKIEIENYQAFKTIHFSDENLLSTIEGVIYNPKNSLEMIFKNLLDLESCLFSDSQIKLSFSSIDNGPLKEICLSV